MTTPSTTPKIFGQIVKVMHDLSAIGKDSKNVKQQFNFRSIDAFYNELHPLFVKHSIFTAPELLDSAREERKTNAGGSQTVTVVKMKYTFYADDGSSFPVIVMGEGADSGDKSATKAMAIAHKYALTQTFVVPTEDSVDPDRDSVEFVASPPPRLPQPNKDPGNTHLPAGKLIQEPVIAANAKAAQVIAFLQEAEKNAVKNGWEKSDVQAHVKKTLGKTKSADLTIAEAMQVAGFFYENKLEPKEKSEFENESRVHL